MFSYTTQHFKQHFMCYVYWVYEKTTLFCNKLYRFAKGFENEKKWNRIYDIVDRWRKKCFEEIMSKQNKKRRRWHVFSLHSYSESKRLSNVHTVNQKVSRCKVEMKSFFQLYVGQMNVIWWLRCRCCKLDTFCGFDSFIFLKKRLLKITAAAHQMTYFAKKMNERFCIIQTEENSLWFLIKIHNYNCRVLNSTKIILMNHISHHHWKIKDDF